MSEVKRVLEYRNEQINDEIETINNGIQICKERIEEYEKRAKELNNAKFEIGAALESFRAIDNNPTNLSNAEKIVQDHERRIINLELGNKSGGEYKWVHAGEQIVPTDDK